MITPLDIEILRLGLDFVKARSLANWNLVSELIIPSTSTAAQDKFSCLQENVTSAFFQGMQHNCCHLHADIKDEKHPQIHLKFCDSTATKVVYSETLFTTKNDKGSYKISSIKNSEIVLSEEGLMLFQGDVVDTQKITPLKLLSVVIPFTIADALCDTSFHEPLLAENVKAFGAIGKEQVLEFKEKFLGPQRLLENPAYKLADPFIVDIKGMKVTLGFECLIKKYLGKGTDYVYLDEKLKVEKIDVVRHSGKYTD